MSEAAATHTFKCPNCGGEITYSGGAATSLQCHYCGMSVPVPDALRPKQPDVITPVVLDVSSIMRVAGTGLSGQQRQSQRTGCIIGAIVVFVIGIILLTTVLPLVLVSNVTSQIPAIPAEVGAMATAIAEPTREPTRRAPTPTPTPAFAEVALKFGSQGMGPGQFDNAHAGGLDGAGHIYVGEYNGGRIQVFDSTGKFINQFFVGDQHTLLLGFAVDRQGTVYVADGGDVTRYDGATGKSLGKLNYSGGPGFGELALAPDGSLYAMWYQRRSGIFTSTEGAREDLVHFDSSGKVVKVIKGVISSMTDNVELDNALAADGRGNVYVAAQFESTIFKFDSNGKFITRIGSSGDGSSQFRSLGAIAVDGQGRLFVVESSNISVLKPDGSRLDSIEASSAARSLVFDDAGALLVTTDDSVVKFKLNEK